MPNKMRTGSAGSVARCWTLGQCEFERSMIAAPFGFWMPFQKSLQRSPPLRAKGVLSSNGYYHSIEPSIEVGPWGNILR
jgi:hypothetical protein